MQRDRAFGLEIPASTRSVPSCELAGAVLWPWLTSTGPRLLGLSSAPPEPQNYTSSEEGDTIAEFIYGCTGELTRKAKRYVRGLADT